MNEDHKTREDIKILAIGAAVQDVYLKGRIFTPKSEHHEKVEEFELGSKNDIDGVFFSTGGGATNAAVTFARHGFHAMFMGKIGRDIAGRAVMDALHKEAIDTSLVKYLDDECTGYSCILLAPNGERTILTCRGASAHFDINEDDFGGVKPDWIYLTSLAGNLKSLKVILDYAQTHGIKVAMNPGKDELQKGSQFIKFIPGLSIISLNKEEAEMIYPGKTLKELAIRAAKNVPYVVITDGQHGAVATDRHNMVFADIYKDVPVVDRSGAGDAFSSGFVAAIAAGESIPKAMTFASANSTSVVSKIGSKTGILAHGASVHEMPLKVTDI